MNIYDNLEKIEQKTEIADVSQILDDVERYEQFFKVEEGDVVVDVGAHIGAFAKLHVDKASKIYAIEPDPLFNKEFRGLSPKLESFEIGIGGYDGEANIVSDGNANAIGEEGIPISILTFRTFIERNEIRKIDFLKIDCEGEEYNILTKENIQWISKNCRKVAGEFHIHNDRHRTLLPYVLMLLEDEGLSYVLTSVDGVILSKKNVLSKLDYYTEILFYFRADEPLVIVPEEPIAQTNYHYVNGCFLELLNWPDEQYTVQFIDRDNGKTLHQSVIGTNCWTKCNYQYYVNWQIVISANGQEIRTINQELENRRVLISLESKSLGDTLAWMPYAEEFRKKHNCQIVLSTYINELFVETYPDIEFVSPGTVVEGIIAQYNIGWFYNGDKVDLYRNPSNPRTQPMQKTASDILGLEFKEIKPILTLPEATKTDTVTIGFHSTANCKYWHNPTGWQDVVNYINSIGYTALILSKEGDGWMDNFYPDGVVELPQTDLQGIIKELVSSKLYIGIGTGLSWLAWACNVPTILISGFSLPYTEMVPQDNYIRIGTPEGLGISTGCFNKYKLDPSDWNWWQPKELCNTERMFEDSKLIESSTVIEAVKSLL